MNHYVTIIYYSLEYLPLYWEEGMDREVFSSFLLNNLIDMNFYTQ